MNATATATALNVVARTLGTQPTTVGGNLPGVVIRRGGAEVTLTIDEDGAGVIVSALSLVELADAEERGTSLDPMLHATWADAPVVTPLVILDAVERAIEKLHAAGHPMALAALAAA